MVQTGATPGTILTFYSYMGGTGCTMAVANTAWILASNEFRVLIVDWDLESPGLHRYLHPFLVDSELIDSPGVIDMVRDFADATLVGDSEAGERDWVAALADVQQYAVGVDWNFPGAGRLDFVPAGRQVRSYATIVSTFDWPSFYDELGGGIFLRALRDNMRANYDFVLIDSRAGLGDTAGICTVRMPDAVVVCFTLSAQSIDGAAAVARSIRNQRPGMRIYPAPMRVEDSERSKLEIGRDYARTAFAPLLANHSLADVASYWGKVGIPYKTFYLHEKVIAPFGDRAGHEDTLLAAFERLASVVSDGAATNLRSALAEDERQRWLIRISGH